MPVGALTDRFGARLLFPLVSALTIVPVLLLIPARVSYGALLAVGFVLGLGGTTFAIGVPLVNSWFPPRHRGAALGVFGMGMGMGGVALSGYFTPRTYRHGESLPFLVLAAALAGYALVAALLLRDRPGRPVPTTPLATRLAAAGRLRGHGELSALYTIGFGGIVAFGVYLPTYLKTWYGLGPTDAGTRAAGFALVTVVFRPIGGWLADRVRPAVVTAWALGAVAFLAVLQAFDPARTPTATVCLLLMAAGLGTAGGAVFALVSRVTPAAAGRQRDRHRGRRGRPGRLRPAAGHGRRLQRPVLLLHRLHSALRPGAGRLRVRVRPHAHRRMRTAGSA